VFFRKIFLVIFERLYRPQIGDKCITHSLGFNGIFQFGNRVLLNFTQVVHIAFQIVV
jgi:hypothetical protein